MRERGTPGLAYRTVGESDSAIDAFETCRANRSDDSDRVFPRPASAQAGRIRSAIALFVRCLALDSRMCRRNSASPEPTSFPGTQRCDSTPRTFRRTSRSRLGKPISRATESRSYSTAEPIAGTIPLHPTRRSLTIDTRAVSGSTAEAIQSNASSAAWSGRLLHGRRYGWPPRSVLLGGVRQAMLYRNSAALIDVTSRAGLTSAECLAAGRRLRQRRSR